MVRACCNDRNANHSCLSLVNSLRNQLDQKYEFISKKRRGGQDKTRIGTRRSSRQISKVLGIPESKSTTPTTPELQRMQQILGAVTKGETKSVKQLVAPVLDQLSQSSDFQSLLFSRPLIQQELGLSGVELVQMKDGTPVLKKETETKKEIEARYEKAEKEVKDQGWISSIWTNVTSAVSWIGNKLKNAAIYLKNKIVTLFTYLYDNVTMLSWMIRTLLTVKRLFCETISRAFKVVIFRPSQVTWFYKLRKYWDNLIVPVANVAWPGLKGIFFSLAPDLLNQLTTYIDTAQAAAQAVGSELGGKIPETEEQLSSLITSKMTEYIGTTALGVAATAYLGPIVPLLASFGPILKVAGPYLIKALSLLDTAGSLKELIYGSCFSVKIEATDDLKSATHTMELSCEREKHKKDVLDTVFPESKHELDVSKCDKRNKLIRFTPLKKPESTIVGRLEEALFPEGHVDVSIQDLSQQLRLPLEFIESESESYNLLKEALKTKEMTEEAYEAMYTLIAMRDLLLQSGEQLPKHALESIALLKQVTEAMQESKLDWNFKTQWDQEFAKLVSHSKAIERKSTKEKRSESKRQLAVVQRRELRDFAAKLQLALAKEEELHGKESPKYLYLSKLFESVQNVMISSQIELLDKRVLDEASEAIERYRAGRTDGARMCLTRDQDLLLLLAPYRTTNPMVQTLYDQLNVLLNESKGWISWCTTDDAENKAIDVEVWVQGKEKGIESVDREKLGNLRGWAIYDKWYSKLPALAKTAGHQSNINYEWSRPSYSLASYCFPFSS